jgi:hypothetical protein
VKEQQAEGLACCVQGDVHDGRAVLGLGLQGQHGRINKGHPLLGRPCHTQPHPQRMRPGSLAAPGPKSLLG